VSSGQGEWRPDPTGRHEYRFWDGARDTEHVADGGVVSIDLEPRSAPLSVLAGDAPGADERRSSIEVAFGAVERQNRWTVAFRFLLLIPQFFVLFVLGIAAYVVWILGWFAALVLGRLPGWVATFLTRYLQYVTRVSAYTYLLFDAYPPFTLSATRYPATVEARPTRLNRLAVLFRLVLMIPAVIVMELATMGVAFASFVIWLIVLIAGRMPRALSEAIAAVVRYQTRVYGYVLMVTSTYPGGLFGDKLLQADAAVVVAPPPAATATATDTPLAAETAVNSATPAPDTRVVAAPPPPTAAAVAASPATSSPAAQEPPRAMLLMLSRAAKRLMILFLVLGLVYAVVNGIAFAVAVSNARSSIALHNKVVDDYNQFGSAAQTFQSDITSCPTNTTDLTCANAAYGQLAIAATKLDNQLASINVPSSAKEDLVTLRATAAHIAALASQLSRTSDPNTFAQGSFQIASVATKIDAQAQQLANDLP
jgi:hypothetical protein